MSAAAMVRHEVRAAMQVHGRVCAAEMLLADEVTPAVWRLLAAECDSLESKRGTYRNVTLRSACLLMANGGADDAVAMFVVACGCTTEEWVAETSREMGVRS